MEHKRNISGVEAEQNGDMRERMGTDEKQTRNNRGTLEEHCRNIRGTHEGQTRNKGET